MSINTGPYPGYWPNPDPNAPPPPGTPPPPEDPTSGPGSPGWEAFLAQLAAGQTTLGGDRGFLGGIRDQYGQIAAGNDPYLAALRNTGVSDQQRRLALSGVSGSASENQLNTVSQQYDTMGLGRRDAALNRQVDVTGRMSDLTTTGVELGAIAPGLDIGWLAAQRAGEDGHSGG